MKKIPKGISDFKKVRRLNCEWVDKSLLIQEVIDSSSEVILFPRPRRFGKTLNLSMLRYFFEKGEESSADLFEGTRIQQHGDVYAQEQGKYPVIFLSFKEVKGDSWELCYKKICDVFAEEVKRHLAILSHEALDPVDLIQLTAIKQTAAQEHVMNNSLKLLSHVLSQYHQQKVIVLIDEYDVPIHNAYLSGFYAQAISFMRTLLGAVLKDNTALHKGVLTGALRIAKESIFTDLNNVSTYSVLNKQYSSYFGFTEKEVTALLETYHLSSMLDDVKKWYNGYQFGETTIYNPWSILSFIENGERECRPYWVNTSDNALIRQLMARQPTQFRVDFELLIQGGTVEKTISEHIVLSELNHLSEQVYSFLLFTGYLRAIDKRFDQLENQFYYTLQIPNLEVKWLFEQIFRQWLEKGVGDDPRLMLQALVSGKIGDFSIYFSDYVMNSVSLFDLADRQPERIYHAFVLGMLVLLKGSHEIKSNRESGLGRYDVLLIPKDTSQLGLIIEFKRTFAERGDTLASAAEAALQQIEEKQYQQELKQRGIASILALGIAFQGKQVLIKEKILSEQ
ncbi:MAG: AAA family ATPase [Chlamydiia bacterium]|nr:AAA family ATPase [Chlamydiia bacterium]